MKQVNSKYYNQKYFQFQSNSPNFSLKLTPKDFHKKYLEIASILKLNSKDKICDLGCGTGDLSFLLWLKYHCSIIAIDYSADAIKICRQKKKLFTKNNSLPNILFLNKNNQNLPKLKNIKAVYLCDVVEHLYPSEIDFLLKEIIKWGKPNILIHTDNNNYLKLIEPLLNFISLILRKTNLKKIKQTKQFHQKRHVNLTTPKKLSKVMKQFGYFPKIIQYPQIDQEIIIKQLGPLASFNFLVKLSQKILKLMPILSPSFYCLYSSTN